MSDIQPRSPAVRGLDFLSLEGSKGVDFAFDGILTNPPFNRAGVAFVEQALRLTEGNRGWVMMLFGSEWDTAAKRPHLLSECPQYVGKIIHQERIVWFQPEDRNDDTLTTGKPKKKPAAPSSNHAWFVWDWRNPQGRKSTTSWIPKREVTKGGPCGDGDAATRRPPEQPLVERSGADNR